MCNQLFIRIAQKISKMRRIFLGKNHLHWCDTCGVPVLGAVCACGAPTRSVDVTPPGDIRPAFPYDVNLINSIYSDAFGAPLIPEGHLALLNKTPSDDRMEEIIMGGAVIGGIRYFPDEKRWKPVLRPSSTRISTASGNVTTISLPSPKV